VRGGGRVKEREKREKRERKEDKKEGKERKRERDEQAEEGRERQIVRRLSEPSERDTMNKLLKAKKKLNSMKETNGQTDRHTVGSRVRHDEIMDRQSDRQS